MIPFDQIPEYDEVHVVSDLHLGGSEGFQIFDSGPEFQSLVKLLTGAGTDRRIALVVNGDLVDFLAEEPATYFDASGAVAKLDRIAGDPAFIPVWDALASFVGTENHFLVVVLGNHDLELALPWVRERLLQILSRGVAGARGRITLAFDGAGYLCRVRRARIQCLHGNELDAWNLTDYEAIRRIGRDLNRGQFVPKWVPNAGTQLVIDVMNELKHRFAFIDLLKPEGDGVLPILTALLSEFESEKRDRVGRALGVARRLAWDQTRWTAGFLGTVTDPAGPIDATRSPTAGRPWAGSDPGVPAPATTRRAVADSSRALAELMLSQAEEQLRAGVFPSDLVASDSGQQQLGYARAAWNYVRGKPGTEVLREALGRLKCDRSFDPEAEDANHSAIEAWVDPAIEFVVSGHTHLERALHRWRGPGYYYNSGTWVRLIRLHDDLLNDPAQFDSLFHVLRDGTMAALDKFPGLVLRKRPVVSIWADGPQVRSALRHFNPDGSNSMAFDEVGAHLLRG